jgi:hypothetical protein
VNLISPSNGSRISGNVSIIGTADIPNFGFYTLEVARPGDTIWLPNQVGQQPVKNDALGAWDTTAILGEYMLRLVVKIMLAMNYTMRHSGDGGGSTIGLQDACLRVKSVRQLCGYPQAG